MEINVDEIYLAKLSEIKSRIESTASRFSGVSSPFQDILDSLQEKMDAVSLGLSSFLGVSSLSNSGITIDTTNVIVNTAISPEIESAIQKASKETGLNPNLIKGVIQTESSFHTDSVSSCGAKGLMQLMPATAREMGVTDPMNAEQNVRGGSAYLKKLIDRFGDVRLAIAAYNSGPTRVSSLNITNADDYNQYSRISSGVRGYVSKVLNYTAKFSQLNA